MRGEVVSVLRAPEGGGAMESLARGRLGERGLRGDRYPRGSGTWSRPGLWSPVTLVEAEAAEAAGRELGREVRPPDLRRNVVTRGVRLDTLIGRRFRVGEALLEGVRPCEPCGYLEERAGIPGLRAALQGRGGIRARVVEPGEVAPGDPVRLAPGEP